MMLVVLLLYVERGAGGSLMLMHRLFNRHKNAMVTSRSESIAGSVGR